MDANEGLNTQLKSTNFTNLAVLVSAILASSMAFIDSTALNVALPAIQDSFNASGVQLLWVINAYMLMLASLILVGGSLGDKLGRKKVFMTGISIFIAGSLFCGLSPSIEWLIVARIIQGIGGALMIPGSLAIITACYEEGKRGAAIGIWSAATTIVVVIGPVLGGILSDLGLWRAVFLINLPIGITCLIILFAFVPESRDETMTKGIDYLGAFLIIIGLAGLTYGMISAPELGYGSPNVFGTLLVGILALVGFIFVERRSDHPLLPLTLFRSRTFSGTNLVTLFLYGGLSVMTFFLALNLVQIQGYTKTQAGLAFLPFPVVLILLSRWAGGISDKKGARIFLVLGPSLAAFGFLLLALPGLTSGASEYWTTFFPGIVFFGIGMGLTVAPLTSTVMGSVASHYSGTASGINNAISRTAGVLAIALVGGIVLTFFSSQISQNIAPIQLDQPIFQEVLKQASNLGDAQVPPSVPEDLIAQVQNSFDLAFVATFRMTMFICTGLAVISAGMAGWLVES